MTIKEAVNVLGTSSRVKKRQAIIVLKARYTLSKKAFDKRGIKTQLMNTLENAKNANQAHSKKVTKLSDKEMTEVLQDYQNYFSNKYEGKRYMNKTASLKGYREWQENTAKALGNLNYKKLSESEKRDFWDLVDRARELGTFYKHQEGTNDVLQMFYDAYNRDLYGEYVEAARRNGFIGPLLDEEHFYNWYIKKKIEDRTAEEFGEDDVIF